MVLSVNRVGLVDSVREENKARAGVEIYHNLPIPGNASSNYRTPAVHRAGPPPRTDRDSGCWYSKKIKMRATHETSPAPCKQ